MHRRDRPAHVGLGELAIAVEFEQVLHVAERLQAGDEVDESLARIVVELAHGLGVEGRIVRSDLWVAAEAERVLGVEHQHVELELHAEVDHLAQAGGGRNLAA